MRSAVRAAAIATALAGLAGVVVAAGFTPTVPRADPADATDAQPALQSLDAVATAWSDELDDLASATRGFAIADDTYDFVTRPNLPYVYDRYAPEQLRAARVDTVLIVDGKGAPRFWRPLNDRRNRGFPDAERFLAALPKLSVPSEPGTPALAGAVRLPRGPALVVAIPIYPASRTGPTHGWLIGARALDEPQWQRYGQRSPVKVEAVNPQSADWPAQAVYVPGQAPTPVVQVDATRVRGWLPVYDINGDRLELFSVTLPRAVRPPSTMIADPPRIPSTVSWVAGLVAALGAVVAALLSPSAGALARSAFARTRAARPARSAATPGPSAKVAPRRVDPEPAPAVARDVDAEFDSGEFDVSTGVATLRPATAATAPAPQAVAAPAPPGAPEPETSDAPVFRFQPQIDLGVDRIAGVEALFCVFKDDRVQVATGLLEDADAAGLALDLAERWLRAACSERRAWAREVKSEIPVSVPVSPRALESPGFPAMLGEVLSASGLDAVLLELEVPESAVGGSATTLRTLEAARELGVRIAIDGFGRGAASLRSLTALRVSKVRIDAALIREAEVDGSASAMVHALVGAARALNIDVCASGVDSPDQTLTLAVYGPLLGQGAALAPLMESGRVLAALRQSGSRAAAGASGDDIWAEIDVVRTPQ